MEAEIQPIVAETEVSECLCPCHFGHTNYHCHPPCCENATNVVDYKTEVQESADILIGHFGII